MLNNLQKLLAPEEREEKKQEIERIKSRIDSLEYEVHGGPDYDEDDFDYESAYNNSPERHLESLYTEKEELEDQLFKDDYYKQLAIFSEKQKETQNLYSLGTILNDHLPTIDLLNREPKAREIANIICADSSTNSFNVGVIGEWGSGKSTFIDFIKKFVIQNSKSNNNTIVLSYDASSYSDQNQIWASFSKLLFERYENNILFPRFKYTFVKVNKNKKKYFGHFVLYLATIFAVFLLVWGSKYSFSFDALIGKFVGYGFTISGLLLLTTQIIIPWIQKSISASIPLSQKILSKFSLPSYIETLGTREQISNELNILFEAWIPKSNQKIVIFVDELDRCSNKGISEFFQSIQLFVPTKKLIFVFAIEPSHIKTALLNTYDLSKDEIDAFTMQYLDKYVSVVIPLDNNFSYRKIVNQLVCEVNNGNTICITDDELKAIEKCIDILPHNYMTPRKVKKLVNLLVLTKDYCINSYTSLTINYCELFSWIVLNSFFHDAAYYATTLYTKQRQFTPLKHVLNYSTQKNLFEKLNSTPYIPIIENFAMNDIIIYNKIANDFSISIY